MGNQPANRYSLTDSARKSDRFIEPHEFLNPREELDLLKSLTLYDRRHDYRFGKTLLYKNATDSIVARIKHRFKDFQLFKNYCEKYEAREKVSSMYLMRILYLYNTKMGEAPDETYIINLIIEYPFNDLKSEMNTRIADNKVFSGKELQKILKAGVGALAALKKSGYRYPFELTKYSICIIEKPNDKKAFRVLEFSNFEMDPLDDASEFEEIYEENCRALAVIVIEAGMMTTKNLLSEEEDRLVSRTLDDFTRKYSENRELCQIVDSFYHQNGVISLEQAEKALFKDRIDRNQRYLFQDDKIVVQTENKRLTRFDAEKMKMRLNQKGEPF